MTAPVGGVRDRLIRKSLVNWVTDVVTQRGWLDSGRRHQPVNFVAQPVSDAEAVPLNTLAVFLDTVDGEPTEIGSNATDDRHSAVVQFYAEGEAIGQELIGDIRAALLGKAADIGCVMPVVPVYDWRDATPPILFYLDVESVRRDRSQDNRDPWRQFLFELTFDLVDEAVG